MQTLGFACHSVVPVLGRGAQPPNEPPPSFIEHFFVLGNMGLKLKKVKSLIFRSYNVGKGKRGQGWDPKSKQIIRLLGIDYRWRLPNRITLSQPVVCVLEVGDV